MNLMNIALSGLNANRIALDVTAQNVANINTPGYSRQQAVMQSVGAGVTNGLSAGMGVEVNSIRRISDGFIVKQLWSSNSEASYAGNFATSMSLLENTLGGEGVSISTGLDSLFASLNDATTKPESQPLRQQIINEAEALSRRFSTLNQSLHTQNQDIRDQRTAAVNTANGLIKNIAAINKQISEVQGAGGNPAQLLDARENAVGELAKIMDIKTVDQNDGTLQISLASGQPLVMGSEFGQLGTMPNPADPNQTNMSVSFANQTFAVNNAMGGSLGALNDYQTDVLVPNMRALNDMAKAVADEFNAALGTGTDLNGNPGKPLFTYDPSNPASSLTITDITSEELALSGDGTPGNGDVLNQLIAISSKPVSITGFGEVTLNDAFTGMVGNTATKARQAMADYEANSAMNEQALAKRNSISAVSSDEEAANLMVFSNAHNANMKVISTANELFNSVLQLF